MAEPHPSDADGESEYSGADWDVDASRSGGGGGRGAAGGGGGGGGGGGSSGPSAAALEAAAAAGAEGGASAPRWMPPASDRTEKDEEFTKFGESFNENFFVPPRLVEKSIELIETANDFHYAMINDLPRNQFYHDALSMCVTPESIVVEIGTGSGLLAMIAVKVGARHVTAIEANRHLAEIARMNIRKNGMSDRITVLNALSSDVTEADLPHGRADVLVSEILGTLLLGESAMEYIPDARARLCKPGCHIVPAKGRQCVELVECESICQITAARNWNGIVLENFNSLKDTASLVFTKQYGFRLSSVPYNRLTNRVTILEVDFYNGEYDDVPMYQKLPLDVVKTGVAHAAIFSWEVFSDQGERYKMSTHVEETAQNFPRDMQWGQGVQLMEDFTKIGSTQPSPLQLEKSGPYMLVINQAEGGSAIQVLVQKSREELEVEDVEE